MIKKCCWKVLLFRFAPYIFKGKPGFMYSQIIIRICSFSGQYFPTYGLTTHQKNSRYGFFSDIDDLDGLSIVIMKSSYRFRQNFSLFPEQKLHIRKKS